VHLLPWPTVAAFFLEEFVMPRRWMVVVALTLGVLFAAHSPASAQVASVHLALGNPSDAKADAANPDPKNYLMVKPHFALSYNSEKGTPNWVSWRLVKEDLGNVARKNDFHPDPDLPRAFYKVKPGDYDHSGFDRGHMCPNADREASADNAKATFVMSNMVPQSAELNRRSWEKLEDYCRKLAHAGKELYIVAGPAGKGGWGLIEKKEKGAVEHTKVFQTTLAGGKVTVPASCWKVVLVLDRGEGPPATRVTKQTQIIAVVMPNDDAPKKWEEHQVTLQQVETLTGFQFFNQTSADALNALRQKAPLQSRRFEPASLFDMSIAAWLPVPARGLDLTR
jgi:endonuclease G, mitochondrial